MGLLSSKTIVFLTIKKEITETIENWLAFVFLPSLRAMRMGSNYSIGTIVYKISIASDGLWCRYINIFNSIMWQHKKVVHMFLSLYYIMIHTQVIDVSAAQSVTVCDVIKHTCIGCKGKCIKAYFFSFHINHFHPIGLIVRTGAKSCIAQSRLCF